MEEEPATRQPFSSGRATGTEVFPMEKPTDGAHAGNEAAAPGLPQLGRGSPAGRAPGMRPAATLTANATDGKGPAPTEEHGKGTEGLPGTERDSAAGLKPAASGRDSPNTEAPVAVTSSSPSPGTLGSGRRSPEDMDCLVCFNRYSVQRAPKLLACQHAFCAVCLKLMLRKDDRTWTISCPLCRKETVVLGGLIRTLHDQDDIMEHLESPHLALDMYISPTGLHSKSWIPTSQDTPSREQAAPADNRLAIQRLVLLLLLLVILTILILPFLYSGLIKWVICLMLTLGVIMSLVLCCNPKFYCSCGGTSLASCHKGSNISAIA